MAVAPAQGVGLRATVRATRALTCGEEASILYMPLDLLTTAERRAKLRAAYGWTCLCCACERTLADARLVAVAPGGGDDAAVSALSGALDEAEGMLADGDADGAAALAQILARGADRLALGPSHRARLRVIALARDAAATRGAPYEATIAARAWLAAAAPLAALLDPATRCHAAAALALAHAAQSGPRTRATRTEMDTALHRATDEARTTLGAEDELTCRLEQAKLLWGLT